MTDFKSIPGEAVRGIVEGAKGLVKEVIGTVTGKDDVAEEGQAQQDKARAQRDAAKKEVQAEQARAQAKTQEQRQKTKQNHDHN
jgi:uncharacterized protein YjbJ (UPF0337 family)